MRILKFRREIPPEKGEQSTDLSEDQTDPPAADGRKVIINDTDHSFYYIALQQQGQAAQRAWAWSRSAGTAGFRPWKASAEFS
jgi:hypothetical protein